MTNTCKTCKWWRTWPDEDSFAFYLRSMMETKDFQSRPCNHPDIAWCEPVSRRDGFSLADASGYFAAIVTGEDFGCPLHEVGENAEPIELKGTGE